MARSSLRLHLFLLPAVWAVGCHRDQGWSVSNRTPSAETQIVHLLEQQAAAWNAGDIEGFMAAYWNSPELSFSSGGQVKRGYQQTLQYFRDRYPGKSGMGKLTFSDLEITLLGSNAALVLGRYRVESDRSSSGAFSLTLRRVDGRWLIIHDHTSRDAA